ncbi:DUF3872 domain-containing protein [Dysgonomonas mossii]|uniref:Conjugative transposon protein TraQ n=1 Tax=Dysgonomonas mossii DSM 22836 TaxID=742767 RepID=F8X3K8_9BACT|nr:DUF3872 domain-containing protein [Dysgonomonas mossii]EGK05318.1 hypothetical protein HMPREF9456_02817 [Dysgonomonas mossii DSM 22836]MDU1890929.1 DUF3872 domain-containing protein [Dysgonomonas sp.]
MKRIKTFFGITAWLAAIMLLALACSNDMDINKVYAFDLVCMPVQKKIVQGEVAEIRAQIVKEGSYEDTKFYIRYFQVDGKGQLKLDNGTILLPNDLYLLEKETFRMYYTSHSTDQQVVDVYIEDSHGQVVQKTFSFQNDRGEEDLPIEAE